MDSHISRGTLRVAPQLADLVESRILPGTSISAATFWVSLGSIIQELAPKFRELLKIRDQLQARIDAWHGQHASSAFDVTAYRKFLVEIGYLLPEGPDFQINTGNVDSEISEVAGPQLVVPVMNARYALNAANARWGSLYDALYGTDAIPEDGGAERTRGYNPERGKRVVAFARGVLDEAAPLEGASWSDATGLAIRSGKLIVTAGQKGGVGLKRPERFVGYEGGEAAPTAIVLRHHGLHLEILIDRG